MAIAEVVTLGFGSFGSIGDVVLLGFTAGAEDEGEVPDPCLYHPPRVEDSSTYRGGRVENSDDYRLRADECV
jgi:hypothetical protein